MIHKVRLWIENGVVQCCSGVCTEQSCNRVGICKETEIAEVTMCKNCGYSIDRNGFLFCEFNSRQTIEDGFCAFGWREES